MKIGGVADAEVEGCDIEGIGWVPNLYHDRATGVSK